MTRFSPPAIRLGAAVLVLALAAGCGTLRPTPPDHPTYYSLDYASSAHNEGGAVPATAALSEKSPTLIVSSPRAASGFDSQRIVYMRESHKREYFAHSEWVDSPARMLAPLIVKAVERTGTFRAVVLTPSTATGDLRLDTEIVRLQQEFNGQPSRVRFTLRTYVVDNATRRVLAWREFDEAVAAASDTPSGGVAAANQAVQAVLERLAGFCSETAAGWQRTEAGTPSRIDARPINPPER